MLRNHTPPQQPGTSSLCRSPAWSYTCCGMAFNQYWLQVSQSGCAGQSGMNSPSWPHWGRDHDCRHPLHSQMFLEVSDCFHVLSSWSSITECGDFALWLIAEFQLNCSALKLLVREILLGGWGGGSLSQVFWTMGGIWSAQREHGNTTYNQYHCCSKRIVFYVFHVK